MSKFINAFVLVSVLAFMSCSGKSTNEQSEMRTGFYFVTDKGDGIDMKLERLNEQYKINRKPFASVKNVTSTEIKRTTLKDGVYTELCMTFDEKGTKDIESGTGNVDHPKLAVIINNKLLYVVDNTTQIKTGIMCVSLIDFSEEQINAAKQAVDEKK